MFVLFYLIYLMISYLQKRYLQNKDIYKIKVSAKIKTNITQNSYIFLHDNDCEAPYIDIFVGLLLITFN